MAIDTEFLWRAEMACRAAWPAEQECDVGGWCARRSGGSIRRVNSLNQRPDSRPIDDRLVDLAQAHYAQFDQPAIVRVISFAGASADLLARRGYQSNGATTTLRADMDQAGLAPEDLPGRVIGSEVAVSKDLTAAWLAARNRIAASDPAKFRSMLALIDAPRLFSCARVDGAIQSVGYGVIVDGLLVLESVATDEAHRGRGLARIVVQALMNLAVAQGINVAVLQVVTDNVPARALYRSLGFSTELFDYFYMQQPQPNPHPAHPSL